STPASRGRRAPRSAAAAAAPPASSVASLRDYPTDGGGPASPLAEAADSEADRLLRERRLEQIAVAEPAEDRPAIRQVDLERAARPVLEVQARGVGPGGPVRRGRPHPDADAARPQVVRPGLLAQPRHQDLDQVLVARLIGAVEPGDELDRPVLPHEGAERMELAVASQEALGDRQKGVGEGVQIKTRLIRRRPS